MTDVLARLRTALDERYALERELGHGGMATVYLAQDARHDRRVAIKVMEPEALGPHGAERFLREIRIAARLNHPHILAVFDSGEVATGRAGDSLLFYVMPYVDGESLRDRLRREGRLSPSEARRITCEVASALDCAHGQGVVHRDIKPENILLLGGDARNRAGGHAIVADFGIARALIPAAGDRTLTQTGLALGTPAYMSPEQAAGDHDVDGRSDIYSLACVTYEMLTGSTPFTGSSSEQIAQRFTTDPPPIHARCPELPAALDLVLRRALALQPHERFPTAGGFAAELDAALPRAPAGVLPPQQIPGRTRLRPARHLALLPAVGVALATLAALIWGPTRSRPVPSQNRNAVAILPFSVNVSDPSLTFLRSGIVRLLSDELGTDEGPRTIDPNTVLDAWQRAGGSEHTDLPQEETFHVARQIGAGQIVLGSIVGTAQLITMSASLVDVESGATRARVSAQGPGRSYGALVDTVANKLIAQRAGEERRLYLLKDIPTSAVRTYVAGMENYRYSRYDSAVAQFQRALDDDSTFAFAAFGLVLASNLGHVKNEEAERGLRIAWNNRSRLNARDRAFLMAQGGPRYPAIATIREQIEGWFRAVDSLPDRPETHFEAANRLFQYGRYIGMGVDTALDLARKYDGRALSIDSAFAPALQRLVEIAVRAGQTARAQRLAALLAARDPNSDQSGYIRWRVAVGSGDDRTLAAIRQHARQLSDASLREIWMAAQLEGVAVEDADSALVASADRATTSEERADAAAGRYLLDLNQGRPRAALRELRRSVPNDRSYLWSIVETQMIRDALFASGDTTAALDAFADLMRTIDDMKDAPDPTPADAAVLYIALCATQEWQLAHHHAEGAGAAVRQMRELAPRTYPLRLGGGNTPAAGAEPSCPAVVDAWAAATTARPDAESALDRLDSLMARGPMDSDAPAGNLVVAHLRETRGDLHGALRALRRRPYAISGLFYLAPSLREEGQLAARVGEREEAVHAYRHYLALRNNPEPPLEKEVADVRVALERLQVVAIHPSPTTAAPGAR